LHEINTAFPAKSIKLKSTYLSKVSRHGLNVTCSGVGCTIALSELVLIVAILATLLSARWSISVVANGGRVTVIIIFIALA
jgi:hypothetical protein